MRRQSKNYETPSEAWQDDRIEEEKQIRARYGLANKREVYKAQSVVRNFRRQARNLNANPNEEQEQQLLDKMTSLGILEKGDDLNDVLKIDVDDVLERRFQTIVYRRGLANTAKKARQLINHGHIQIDDRRVTVPSYLVRVNEESEIRVSPGAKHIVSED